MHLCVQYRSIYEVSPSNKYFIKFSWSNLKLFVVGGTQSTLQDIKVPQRAGGYGYKDPSRPHARNRFIYW